MGFVVYVETPPVGTGPLRLMELSRDSIAYLRLREQCHGWSGIPVYYVPFPDGRVEFYPRPDTFQHVPVESES